MIIGFSGTRHGMTREQIVALWLILESQTGDFHHGDCLGADTQAHTMASLLGWSIVIHPPDDNRMRANNNAPVVLAPTPYLDRNQDIVDESDVLVAAPQTAGEELRSGTWAAIRYASYTHKPLRIILPRGMILRAMISP